jgi:CRISPR-associated protein Csm1
MKHIDQIVLASLLHDIGKFFERAEILDEYRNDLEKRQSYCRKKQPEGYYTHIHVLNTLRFCDLLSDKVPQIKPTEFQKDEQADQNWINLAAYHHNPSDKDISYLEKIVQAADHFASAEREAGDFYEKGLQINKKTRLESLLGRINLTDKTVVNNYFLPLKPLSLSKLVLNCIN